MNPTLMKAIVEYAAFLSLSRDDVIQPDAAVAQLEQLATALKELSPADRQTFSRFINSLAAQERQRGRDKNRLSFLETLPQNLGIG
jgi:hypothetical protein